MDFSKIFKFLKLDQLFDSVSAYMEARLELFKLEAREEISEVLAKGVQTTLILSFLAMALFFGSFTAAIFIGEYMESYGMGFLIVTLFYFVVGILLYILRNKLGIKDRINRYLEKKEDQEDE